MSNPVSLREIVPLIQKDANTISLVYDGSAYAFSPSDEVFMAAWGGYAVKSISASPDVRSNDKDAMAFEIALATYPAKAARVKLRKVQS